MLWFNFHLGSFFFSNQFAFFKPVNFLGSAQPFRRANVFKLLDCVRYNNNFVISRLIPYIFILYTLARLK